MSINLMNMKVKAWIHCCLSCQQVILDNFFSGVNNEHMVDVTVQLLSSKQTH